ncbi:CpaF family protein [Pseudidiomarina sp.]|uniref:CpaF family protein n=1 Tax=Pseudidiomarina sp. TaxID=2081707 RepID=UPI00299D1C96|nr:CpaF family protein [Pseudidiomarina sp.]MDX1706257.1 CpaF family protein [Pseudidiomarina sp.]
MNTIDKDELKHYLRTQLQRAAHHQQMGGAELTTYANKLLVNYVSAEGETLTAQQQRDIQEVIDDCLGLGPLAKLLGDPSITEIMVNDFSTVFVERDGCLQRSSVSFSDEASLLRVIDRIVLPLGRRLDSAQPMVDARLPDGSRVNAVLGPLATRGTCMTIRKFSVKNFRISDLVAVSSLSREAADYLIKAVATRRNILISGGTGTGKTTLLNVLAAEVPEGQRIVTIEDAAELRLQHENLITLEARPANAEGKGQISIRELLVNALRMRPDRIIIGECRGAEAIDMLQAMNTGHDGSLTTLHANSPREALQRLEVMVMMAGMDMPLLAIRQQVVAAIQVIVQIVRRSDGSRGVAEISEVTGIDGGSYQLSSLFRSSGSGLSATGIPSEWMSQQ